MVFYAGDFALKERRNEMRGFRRTLFLASSMILLVSCGGSQQNEKAPAAVQTQSGKRSSPNLQGCVGFSVDDAAQLLAVSAGQVTPKIEETYKGFWQCSYTAAGGSNGVSFSVTVSPNGKKAAEEMEQYRSNLELAGGQPQWKNLPKGTYSDIMGLGDEAVWTDINGSLSARKGNITVQVLQPPGKMEQIKVAQAILKKL
jgi:hypothetical protein